MRYSFKTLLKTTAAIAAVLIVVWSIVFGMHGFAKDGAINAATFPVFLDGYKAIGLGFLVAILATVVPQLLPEEKYRFERLRDSREAYSKAQTGITYLPNKLATLGYAESVALLQSVHEHLHVAQTYTELSLHLAPYDTPEKWGPSKYRTLMAVKEVLQRELPSWDSHLAEHRLHLLQEAIALAKKRAN